ncbi:MAG: hypothetical protein R3E08_00925 [Thiotrichaceae bacterium]
MPVGFIYDVSGFLIAGEIGVFIDDDTISHIENLMQHDGYLDGKAMANSFRLIRSNSLIWHYFVHNYLYGEALPTFDVLFWNNDSTRLPAAMRTFYLREFYLNNKLMQPSTRSACGDVTLIFAIFNSPYMRWVRDKTTLHLERDI